MNRMEAIRYRETIVAGAANLPDIQAIDVPLLFPQWDINIDYIVGVRICYNNVLYKCVQAHTSQASWTPDLTPALWTRVSVEEWPDWVQPIGVQDAYMMGDKVSHNGSHWISIIDYNTWEPGVYGWEVQ